EAFLRGGQLSMAERMGDALSGSDAPPPPAPAADVEVSAVRDAATEAAARISARGVELSVEEERPRGPSGEWKVVEAGAEPLPRASAPPPATAATPPTLASLSASWALALPEDAPLAVGAEGELLVCTEASVHSRVGGLR